MMATTSASEDERPLPQRSRWLLASLVSFVLGLAVYSVGYVLVAYGNILFHHASGHFDDWWGDMMTVGAYAEEASIILVMLGIVFYVTWKWKGV